MIKYFYCPSKNLDAQSQQKKSTRKRCSKLTLKMPERPQWSRSVVSIINFENISCLFYQGSTNLIFACSDFRARKMVLLAHSCTQICDCKTVTLGANLYRLIYNLVTAIVLSLHKLSDIHSRIWFYFLMKFTLLPVILTLSNNWLDLSK